MAEETYVSAGCCHRETALTSSVRCALTPLQVLRGKGVIYHLNEIDRAWQIEARPPGTEKSLFLGPGRTHKAFEEMSER